MSSLERTLTDFHIVLRSNKGMQGFIRWKADQDPNKLDQNLQTLAYKEASRRTKGDPEQPSSPEQRISDWQRGERWLAEIHGFDPDA